MHEMREFYIGDEHPMYVQCWRPSTEVSAAADRNIVLVHGGAHTGICWTETPDSRAGWARRLADLGYTAYVIDWPGTGRSRRWTDALEVTPTWVVDSLEQLLAQTGPAVLIGHSIGAAIAMKVVDVAPRLVKALIAIAPSSPPNTRPQTRMQWPTDQPIVFNAQAVHRFFTNGDRFPRDHIDAYTRSLCDFSPHFIHSAQYLTLDDLDAVRRCPSLVIAADQDTLTPALDTRATAEFLSADYIATDDWGLSGFGHMLPIELGCELVLKRALDWLDSSPTSGQQAVLDATTE